VALSLADWLQSIAHIDEAEATALLHALFQDWFEGSSAADNYQGNVSVSQLTLEPAGPGKLRPKWESPEGPIGLADSAGISRSTIGWLLVEILLRQPIPVADREGKTALDVLGRLNQRWQADFGRGLMEDACDFIKLYLVADAELSLEELEIATRQLARRCRRELPQRSVSPVFETLVVALDLPAIERGLLTMLRIVLIREEGTRYLRYLKIQPGLIRWSVYLRAALFVALILAVVQAPACLAQLDQRVRHSWYAWRGSLALPSATSIVVIDDWRGIGPDGEKLVQALATIVDYEPRAVGIAVHLEDLPSEYWPVLKGILAEHPEVFIVGKYSPYGLKAPSADITGIQPDPAAGVRNRVCSDLIRKEKAWWRYGGLDDYQLWYELGDHQYSSLAYTLALMGESAPVVPSSTSVNYACSYQQLMESASALHADLLWPAEDDSELGQVMRQICDPVLRDKLVLLGADAADQDRHASPFDRLAPPDNGIPGAVVHYFALATLLHPQVKPISLDQYVWLINVLVILLSLALVRLASRGYPLYAAVFTLACYFAGVSALIWGGLYLPWLPIFLAFLITYPTMILVADTHRRDKVRAVCES